MNSLHDKRMGIFKQAGLYLVTSQVMSSGRTTREIVKAALLGGVKLIQLREKHIDGRELFELAKDVRAMTAAAGALLIINDGLDIAMGVGADGVHLGQGDFPIAEARKLAPDMIIGASSHDIEEAVNAESDGASYVNIGPIFTTGTKKWTKDYLGLEGLTEIAPVLKNVPFTVMGGIKKKHIPDLLAAGASTIALVTAVTAADDPELATRELLNEINVGE